MCLKSLLLYLEFQWARLWQTGTKIVNYALNNYSSFIFPVSKEQIRILRPNVLNFLNSVPSF